MEKDTFVKEITNIDEDFAKWYTDIVLKAELADYSETKGCIVIRPYGYAIWEKIQEYTDEKFKATGVQNTSFPMLIPESLLQKEKDHVEGFAPEVAWVTNAGGQELDEKLCIRPTSETIISTMYSKWLSSWRDLPFVYNQCDDIVYRAYRSELCDEQVLKMAELLDEVSPRGLFKELNADIRRSLGKSNRA